MTGRKNKKTLKYESLSLQFLLSVEFSLLAAVAPGLCGVDVVVGRRCRITVLGEQINFSYLWKYGNNQGPGRKGAGYEEMRQ